MWLVISNTPAIELDYVTGSLGGMSVWQINTFCEHVRCDSTYKYVENVASSSFLRSYDSVSST